MRAVYSLETAVGRVSNVSGVKLIQLSKSPGLQGLPALSDSANICVYWGLEWAFTKAEEMCRL